MQKHIYFDANALELHLLDQRFLPETEKLLVCSGVDDLIAAIQSLAVRGAPAIGVAGAYAVCLALKELAHSGDWRTDLKKSLERISSARPTAVNLAWAVRRMHKYWQSNDDGRIASKDLLSLLIAEAQQIEAEDIAICKAIGFNGAGLLESGARILTHCNAGSLATAGYGTALGVLRAAKAQGKEISVIADETRPLLQGARLTCWELIQEQIPVRLASDSSAAFLMQRGMVDAVIVGADRIAANGDTANKIGTLGLAVSCAYFDIPFYVAAPLSTIDPEIAEGSAIPIEQRKSEEVTTLAGVRIAPEGVEGLNFAFDVTPNKLISAIITECGVLRAPYQESIAGAFRTYAANHQEVFA